MMRRTERIWKKEMIRWLMPDKMLSCWDLTARTGWIAVFYSPLLADLWAASSPDLTAWTLVPSPLTSKSTWDPLRSTAFSISCISPSASSAYLPPPSALLLFLPSPCAFRPPARFCCELFLKSKDYHRQLPQSRSDQNSLWKEGKD